MVVVNGSARLSHAGGSHVSNVKIQGGRGSYMSRGALNLTVLYGTTVHCVPALLSLLLLMGDINFVHPLCIITGSRLLGH